jgi:hypothetical protein
LNVYHTHGLILGSGSIRFLSKPFVDIYSADKAWSAVGRLCEGSLFVSFESECY